MKVARHEMPGKGASMIRPVGYGMIGRRACPGVLGLSETRVP
jgi:hypothetical protein